VRDELLAAGREDLVDTAVLMVSEVMTNALLHAGTAIEVTAWVDARGLRVEVRDGSPQPPVVRHNAPTAGTGRGLRLLKQMVDAWGCDLHEVGKTVWFELATGDLEGELPDTGGVLGGVQVLARPGDGTVQVELLNVPLLLHVAWHQHAESLLREYLLISLGDDDGLAQLQAHAAASDAMALLLDHIPDPQVGEDADELMATAIEPGVSSAREVMAVPSKSLPHFQVLGETLDAALLLADEGAFLTAPTQPEIRSFRRWVCQEVAGQSIGEDAVPWIDQSDAAPPSGRVALAWDESWVATSPEALIAADDTNGIIAISQAALAMLGYDDATELLGRRLVAIIPSRFRQAHLAGFTMHLSTGRAPLLDRPVSVPALRRDGSETVVELTVESHHLLGGRRVFVAELRP
jgi:PAS domain S-box-containing protein